MMIEVVKITAIGSNGRYATIKIVDVYKTIMIPPSVYTLLRLNGVPTGQSLRYKKDA